MPVVMRCLVMALADLVLEGGFTLVLAIALGLVLIGGLTYLTITVSTANNARLAYMGLYIYLPQPVYVNGTLYVPLYNIGYYRAFVKYLYIRGVDGSIHEYALNLVLGVDQYYVYVLSLNYKPESITVLATPMGYPGIIKEFSANVSTINSIPLIPQTQSQSNSGLIEVVVDDPYDAGWSVVWGGYAGQSYSVSQGRSYAWFINPPYVPIQISFQASITQNPGGYTCQIQPSQVSGTYTAGSVQEFNVACQQQNQQPPPPPPKGGGSSYTATVYVNAPNTVSWTVYLDQYVDGSIVYVDWWSGTGNGGPYTATVSSGLTYLFNVEDLPNGCTASGSPYGIGQTFTPTGPFTEKITITCTSNKPQPITVYGCFFTLSVGANPSAADGGVSSSPSLGRTSYSLATP